MRDVYKISPLSLKIMSSDHFEFESALLDPRPTDGPIKSPSSVCPSVCFSLVFRRNNLKWKLIVLLIFHHQSHIWQNSGSQVVGQNAVSQSNCRIL